MIENNPVSELAGPGGKWRERKARHPKQDGLAGPGAVREQNPLEGVLIFFSTFENPDLQSVRQKFGEKR